MAIPQLNELVTKFAADLQDAYRAQALESVQRALGGWVSSGRTSAPPARVTGGEIGNGRRPTTKKAGKRIRRNETDLLAVENRIVDYVRANPGQGAEQIKAALQLSKKDWTLPISRLVDARKVKAKGDKRSRVYSL
ncbi:MAG: hypothetical protein HOW73_50225 [Polyangiaceae bacterium]|nr:hypothetical protein [Polyangiaceae bacterium]